MLGHNPVAARTYLEESLGLRRELNHRQDMANVGVAAIQQGDYVSAQARLSEGLALGGSDRLGVVYSRVALARLALTRPSTRREDSKYAVHLLAASETLFQSMGVQPAKADRERLTAIRLVSV